MLARTKLLTFLFVLNCPSSLLIPLAKQDGITATNANNLVVRTNQMKEISPNKRKVSEVIQQINVKDSENQVISNINQVILTDEVNEIVPGTVQNDDEGIVQNEPNNLETNGNAVLNNIGETNSLNISLPLLPTKLVNGTSYNTIKVDNATVPTLQNRLANETSHVLNTTNNVKVNNANNIENKEVSTVPNGNTSNINESSSVVQNNTITPAGNEGSDSNGTSLNNNTTSNLKNNSISLKTETTGETPTSEHINEKNILQDTANDANAEISWRSDIPMNKRNKNKIAKLDSQSSTQKNANLNTNNSNGSANNNKNDLLHVNNNLLVDNALKRNTSIEDQKSNKIDKGDDVFIIINTGNMNGLSINAPANDENIQIKAENNTIENLNANNSKLLNDLVNTTINNVLSNILIRNHSNLNTKHNIYLILNSGNITNIHVNSPNLENIVTLKDPRSRRHLNDTKTNITRYLKPSDDKLYPIIDIKFRRGENLESNVEKDKHISTEPLDNTQSNSSTPKYEAVDNATATDSNNTAEINSVQDKNISSAEAPAFRSLIPDKQRKLQPVSNVAIHETNKNKNNIFAQKRMPESPPIFDFNPVANIFSGALDFMKRFKRNSEVEAKMNLSKTANCKQMLIDGQTVISCKNTNKIIIPTRKSLDGNGTNVLKLYDSVELICPLSVFVKRYAHHVLDKLAEYTSGDGIVNKIVNSFVNGDEEKVDLASIELHNLPIPVALKLQLVHGKTKEFIEQLNSLVDSSLCSLG